MAKVVLGMTMSLDGFIQDRSGGVGALYPDLETLRNTEPMIDIMPVLLGDGLRLFDAIAPEQIRLERLKVMELPAGRTHLRFRVVK